MAIENDDNIELDLESIESLEAEALKEINDSDDNNDNDSDNNQDKDKGNNDEDNSEDITNDENIDNNDNASDENDDEPEDNKKLDFKPIEFEISGQKIILNSEEELKAILSKGAESLSKQDDSLSLEKTIIEQGKITVDDLKLLIDAKNGDAKAIAKLAKISNIDILEVDADDADKYVNTFQPIVVSDTEKIAREIANDKEHAELFTKVAYGLPMDFKQAIMSNANDLKAFSNHVKSGLAQQIIPEAMKKTFTEGISFSDAYVKIGLELSNKQPEQKKVERTLTDREKELRKKASEQGNNQSNGGKKKLTVDDIANMPEEEFEKLTKEDLE